MSAVRINLTYLCRRWHGALGAMGATFAGPSLALPTVRRANSYPPMPIWRRSLSVVRDLQHHRWIVATRPQRHAPGICKGILAALVHRNQDTHSQPETWTCRVHGFLRVSSFRHGVQLNSCDENVCEDISPPYLLMYPRWGCCSHSKSSHNCQWCKTKASNIDPVDIQPTIHTIANFRFRQTSEVPISYREVAQTIIKQDGLIGLFGRGLQTRILSNGLQVFLIDIWIEHTHKDARFMRIRICRESCLALPGSFSKKKSWINGPVSFIWNESPESILCFENCWQEDWLWNLKDHIVHEHNNKCWVR